MIKVIDGNCINLIPNLGKFDFIFADPPFNIDHPYAEYKDKLKNSEFTNFTFNWIDACWNACDGAMALHGNDNLAELYLRAARKSGMKRIAWINWHYRFGQCNRSNWIDARCHCLIFAKNENYTWNSENVLVESDRSSTYNDKRVEDTERGGSRLPGTVWGIPSDGPYWGRVQGNNKERVEGCPNQLPEVYLKRLILAYTNKGDNILDPFAGSGTTAIVANALERNCVTIDISKKVCDGVNMRMLKGSVRIKD